MYRGGHWLGPTAKWGSYRLSFFGCEGDAFRVTLMSCLDLGCVLGDYGVHTASWMIEGIWDGGAAPVDVPSRQPGEFGFVKDTLIHATCLDLANGGKSRGLLVCCYTIGELLWLLVGLVRVSIHGQYRLPSPLATPGV
jgi:hypothetical protein